MTKTDLLPHFSSLPDPRVDRTQRYPLEEILLLVISATLSGCHGWSAIKYFGELKIDWLRQFLPYKSGIPVDDTIARLMRKLDTKIFKSCFTSWMRSAVKVSAGDVIALDGKTVRGSKNNDDESPLHMVSAWSAANGVVLGQEKTADKSNEITAIPKLLDALEIKGCLVTLDAMGCQKAIAEKIIDKKADYLLALKGNQGHLHEDVKSFFNTELVSDFEHVEYDYYNEVDKGHGRIEHRECWVIEAKKYAQCFSGLSDWKKLQTLVMIRSTRIVKKKETHETRFYISSFPPNAERMLSAVRNHWGIENCLHWVLDVTFREDESRIRKDFSPENFAIARHISYNLIKQDTSIKASIPIKRQHAAFDDNYRASLLKLAVQL